MGKSEGTVLFVLLRRGRREGGGGGREVESFKNLIWFHISFNSETCSVLLHMGAHTMTRDSNRCTALHHCAAGGCVRTAEALLIYHSTLPLEATDQEGNTPLHVAAKCGHVSILQLMLSRGADITVCNKQNMTCLDVAIESGKEKVAEVLIKNNK